MSRGERYGVYSEHKLYGLLVCLGALLAVGLSSSIVALVNNTDTFQPEVYLPPEICAVLLVLDVSSKSTVLRRGPGE